MGLKMKKLQEIIKNLSSEKNLKKASELAAKTKDKASDLVDTASVELSKTKDAASRIVKNTLHSEEVVAAGSRIRKSASNFFSSLFYILKIVSIASLLSFIIYSARYTLFEIIVMANLTGIDVFLGDVIPFVLIGIIWFVAFRTLRRRFRSGGE